ncbi:MAG: hypothetical protein AB7V07_03395 [Candidatus Delongbacteria bacterium]|jgi:hypothetical protein
MEITYSITKNNICIGQEVVTIDKSQVPYVVITRDLQTNAESKKESSCTSSEYLADLTIDKGSKKIKFNNNVFLTDSGKIFTSAHKLFYLPHLYYDADFFEKNKIFNKLTTFYIDSSENVRFHDVRYFWPNDDKIWIFGPERVKITFSEKGFMKEYADYEKNIRKVII